MIEGDGGKDVMENRYKTAQVAKIIGIHPKNVVASILYFHMLIFSGATLPYEVMPTALQKCSNILPLTQGLNLSRLKS